MCNPAAEQPSPGAAVQEPGFRVVQSIPLPVLPPRPPASPPSGRPSPRPSPRPFLRVQCQRDGLPPQSSPETTPSPPTARNLRRRAATRSPYVTRHSNAQFLKRDYEVIRRLGEGSFGVVDLVRDRRTGRERVCKIVDTHGMGRDELEQMLEEVRVLRNLDHPSIVKIHEYGEDRDLSQLIFILEYVAGGSCRSLMRKRHGKPLGEPAARRLTRQLLQAVGHCHEKGVMHRDLKLEHMILTQAPITSTSVLDCKLIDFGLAASSSASDEHVDRVGTPAYMAPEVVDKDIPYSFKADIWAVGVCVLELLTGKEPFGMGSKSRTYKNILGFASIDVLLARLGEMPGQPLLGASARDFVARLLSVDPAGRPSAAEALGHPWLQQDQAADDKACRSAASSTLTSPRPCPAAGDEVAARWASTKPWAAKMLGQGTSDTGSHGRTNSDSGSLPPCVEEFPRRGERSSTRGPARGGVGESFDLGPAVPMRLALSLSSGGQRALAFM